MLGQEVPYDQPDMDLVKVAVGKRYVMYKLSYLTTAVVCLDCPTADGYRSGKNLDAALDWIARHDRVTHAAAPESAVRVRESAVRPVGTP